MTATHANLSKTIYSLTQDLMAKVLAASRNK